MRVIAPPAPHRSVYRLECRTAHAPRGEVTLQARTEVGDRIGDLDVPQARGAVGEHTLAIGGEGDCPRKANRSRMTNEPPHLLPGRQILQPRCAVKAAAEVTAQACG